MGNPFASQTVSAPIPLPFDEGQWVKLRKLTGKEIDAAQEAHAAGLGAGGSRLWATRFRRLLEGSISDKAQIEQAIADPLTGYDRYALVRSGLVAWSYPQLIAEPVGNKDVDVRAKVAATRQQAIDDLDDEAVDFIATEVLRLTKPGLFHATEEDAETERKNDSGSSTVT